jgi:hypothetical protein
MTYDCPAWELATDTYLLKLQRMQNKVLRTTGNFPRRTSVHDLHMVPYAYDYTAKLCRQQADVIKNHENKHVRSVGNGEARHKI